MNITMEMLQKRKAEALEARDRHTVAANAAAGAAADCDHWLAVLATEEATPEPEQA